MKIVLRGFDLTSFLWRDSQHIPEWAYFITGIDRRLIAVDRKAQVGHHGPGRVSGCTWALLVDAAGCGLSEWTDDWPEGTERWEISLSYHVYMQRDVGKFPTGDPIVPFQATQWVRLVVERNNCSSRWRFNEVVTIFPEAKP
jgi:hypothetical protein